MRKCPRWGHDEEKSRKYSGCGGAMPIICRWSANIIPSVEWYWYCKRERARQCICRNTVLAALRASNNFCWAALSHFFGCCSSSESCCKLLSYGNVRNTVHKRCECVHVFPHLNLLLNKRWKRRVEHQICTIRKLCFCGTVSMRGKEARPPQ